MPFALQFRTLRRFDRRASVRPGGPARIGLFLAGGLGAALVLALLAPAGHRYSLITLLVTAPLFEESFFRGVVHEGLLGWGQRRIVGSSAATWQFGVNVGVALLFGALHAWSRDPWTGAAVVFPALLIGLSYQRQRSVVSAIALHAAFNLVWLAWSQPVLVDAAFRVGSSSVFNVSR
jgi:membrane protease YdiL (CAAX protease family)